MKRFYLSLSLLLISFCSFAQWKVGKVTKDMDYYNFVKKKGTFVPYSDNHNGTITVYDYGYEDNMIGYSPLEKNLEFSGYFFADVKDPRDDYVNIRKGPGTNYPIVQRLCVGQHIYFQKTNTNWLKVFEYEDNYGREIGIFKLIGYIYKDRVKTPELQWDTKKIIKRIHPVIWTKQLCPDEKHPHAIDLGIGEKWACCNVDANSPLDYGGYYAWGEISTKNVYSLDSYKNYNKKYDGNRYDHYPVDIGSDIAGTKYDVAHVKWGGRWKIPNYYQMEKLKENCKYQWTVINGVLGGLFTGPTGNSIFLPAAGMYNDESKYGVGEYGYYCCSSIRNPHPSWHQVDKLFFNSNEMFIDDWTSSTIGFPVRPIWEERGLGL